MPVALAETTSDGLWLELPLSAAHIFIARLFARGVARSLELGDETADVLRLALSEICSEAIERRSGGRVTIDVSADAVPIRITVVASGVLGDEADINSADATYRRTLIEALAPGAMFVEEPDRTTVSFTV
jgi:anti-sigma regulatory factor (Ser/Thr protein kinase)